MNEAKHTPGPWEVFTIEYGRGLIRKVRATGRTSSIATIAGDPRSAAVNDANARLIAAAPTMAAAITEYLAARAGYEVAPTHNSRVCDAAAKRYAEALAGLSTALAAGATS